MAEDFRTAAGPKYTAGGVVGQFAGNIVVRSLRERKFISRSEMATIK
jgi:hypothetical protein